MNIYICIYYCVYITIHVYIHTYIHMYISTGMPGADCCDEYKFHLERGYNDTYFTQDESLAAKQLYLAKNLRERRKSHRQQSRFLTIEEIRRNAELQKRQTEVQIFVYIYIYIYI
jgi:hypothetical protein